MVLWKHQKICIHTNYMHHGVRTCNMKFVHRDLPIDIIPFSPSFSFCPLKSQERLVRKSFFKQTTITENFTGHKLLCQFLFSQNADKPCMNFIFRRSIACEQALYLGLTWDLFWARAASEQSRKRIGVGGELAPTPILLWLSSLAACAQNKSRARPK